MCPGVAEFFPLPPFLSNGDARVSTSRRSCQRLGRNSAKVNRCNAAVYSLNALSGTSSSCPTSFSPSTSVGAVQSVHEKIHSNVTALGSPDGFEKPQAALSTLLGCKASPYEGDPNVVANVELSRLSLPDSAGGCNLCEALDDENRSMLEDFENSLFLDGSDLTDRRKRDGKARVHWADELSEN